MDAEPGKLLDFAELMLADGKKKEARPLVAAHLKQFPASGRAWWLMSQAVEEDRQELECLERVLRLEPSHAEARRRVEALKAPPAMIPAPVEKAEAPDLAVEKAEVPDLPMEKAELPDLPVEKVEVPDLPVAEQAEVAFLPMVAPFTVVEAENGEASQEFDLFAPGAFEKQSVAQAREALVEAIEQGARKTVLPAGGEAVSGTAKVEAPATDQPPEWALPPDEAGPTGDEAAKASQRKKRSWVVDGIIITLVLCMIVAVGGYLVLKDLDVAMLLGLAPTQTTGGSVPSMTVEPVENTWTASVTSTRRASATPSVETQGVGTQTTETPEAGTPQETPTLSQTFTQTPVPPELIGVTIGKYPPEFSLVEPASGLEVSLSDLAGRPILLYFWATGCSVCDEEMVALQEVYEDYQQEGLAVVAILGGGSAAELDAYRLGKGLTFTFLVDPDGAVSLLYKTSTLPHHVFIGLNGRIMFVIPGEMLPVNLENKVMATLRVFPTATP